MKILLAVAILSLGACNPLCWEDETGRKKCGFESMGNVG